MGATTWLSLGAAALSLLQGQATHPIDTCFKQNDCTHFTVMPSSLDPSCTTHCWRVCMVMVASQECIQAGDTYQHVCSKEQCDPPPVFAAGDLEVEVPPGREFCQEGDAGAQLEFIVYDGGNTEGCGNASSKVHVTGSPGLLVNLGCGGIPDGDEDLCQPAVQGQCKWLVGPLPPCPSNGPGSDPYAVDADLEMTALEQGLQTLAEGGSSARHEAGNAVPIATSAAAAALLAATGVTVAAWAWRRRPAQLREDEVALAEACD